MLQDCVNVAGDFGEGKTDFMLRHSELLEPPLTCLSFDYDRGQRLYVVPDRSLAKPGELYYVRRIPAPSFYEVQFLLARIKDPKTPATQLKVAGRPVDANLITRPEVRQAANDIATGKLVVGSVLFDPITRLCEQVTNKVQQEYIDKLGLAKAENMSQLIWARVKDDISELLYSVIELDLCLLSTSWSKPAYDKVARRSTDELVADVMKNVPAFFELSLMIVPRIQPDGSRLFPPMAKVLKSRLRNLPRGRVLKELTWEQIHKLEPDFEAMAPAEGTEEAEE